VKTWDATREDPAWELLAAAYHRRNLEAVEALARSASLRREAVVTIDPDLGVAVELTTTRHDSGRGQTEEDGDWPAVAYGCLPLYGHACPASARREQAVFVAGSAVYALRDGESVTIREEAVPALRTDGQGTFLYQEVWGSRSISYRLNLLLAPGLIPIKMECTPRSGPPPKATVQFAPDGCRIRLEGRKAEPSAGGGQPWLAEVRLFLRNVPEFGPALGEPAGPFAKETPLELYSSMLQLFRPR
jgi:hypothetical protein